MSRFFKEHWMSMLLVVVVTALVASVGCKHVETKPEDHKEHKPFHKVDK